MPVPTIPAYRITFAIFELCRSGERETAITLHNALQTALALPKAVIAIPESAILRSSRWGEALPNECLVNPLVGRAQAAYGAYKYTYDAIPAHMREHLHLTQNIFDGMADEILDDLPEQIEPYDPDMPDDDKRFDEQLTLYYRDVTRFVVDCDDDILVFQSAAKRAECPLARELFAFRAQFGSDYMTVAGDIVAHLENGGNRPSGMSDDEVLHWKDAATSFVYNEN